MGAVKGLRITMDTGIALSFASSLIASIVRGLTRTLKSGHQKHEHASNCFTPFRSLVLYFVYRGEVVRLYSVYH